MCSGVSEVIIHRYRHVIKIGHKGETDLLNNHQENKDLPINLLLVNNPQMPAHAETTMYILIETETFINEAMMATGINAVVMNGIKRNNLREWIVTIRIGNAVLNKIQVFKI